MSPLELPTYKEQRSFYLFLLFVFVTAISIFKENIPDVVFGVLATLWGLFGFYRYLYLSSVGDKKFPQILTLPSRILFGLNQQQDHKVNVIIGRFLKADIVFWVVGGFFFMMWGLYCSLYPAEISLIENFWDSKKDILTTAYKTDQNYYSILQSISYYFMLALIGFMGISYAENPLFLRQVRMLLLPIILVVVVYAVLFLSLFSLNSYGDYSHIRGIGWGQFQVFKMLAPDQLQKASSGFSQRYIETGIVGAYGLYLIFSPMLFCFLKQVVTGRHRLDYIVASILLVALFAFDFFWMYDSIIGGFQILTLAYLTCFWGNCRVSDANP